MALDSFALLAKIKRNAGKPPSGRKRAFPKSLPHLLLRDCLRNRPLCRCAPSPHTVGSHPRRGGQNPGTILGQYRIILSADNTLCIIEHFGNADAVPQPPERCLSRKAGIVRCCLRNTCKIYLRNRNTFCPALRYNKIRFQPFKEGTTQPWQK